MSNIKISGRIFDDPVMRYTKTGKAVLSWKIGLYTGKTGDDYNKSVWVTCYAWEQEAERLNGVLAKKMAVTVEGQPLPPRTYEKDGIEKQVGLEINARRVAIGDEFGPVAEENF